MLHSVRDIFGFRVHATDGNVGQVSDLYLDDEDWNVRYFVVDTGPWLLGRKVLLVPSIIDVPRWQVGEFPVDLSQEEVRNSPEIDLAKPVSRQMEEKLHGYYRWVPYWRAGGRALAAAAQGQAGQNTDRKGLHLRSAQEVIGYHIQARDGEIGHIKDLIVDGECWCIRYMLANTRNWLPGRDVLIAQQALTKVEWAASKVYLDLSKQQVQESPGYEEGTPISRDYEERLHQHYGFAGYWLHSPLV